MNQIKYSVIIPLKNEESNVIDLITELESVMKSIGMPWEVICIDDGSTDKTLPMLIELTKKNPHLRIIAFNKNYGQSSAFHAGFTAARGEYIITMDGDRQNDPADIPKLISLIHDCDLVCGIRKKRKDPLSKRIISKIANKVRRWICDDGVQDTGCSLKIFKADSLRRIKMYHGMHRFLPALFKIEDFKIKEIPVNHRERERGKSKYNFFNRSFNTIADLLAVRWMKKRKLKYQIKNSYSMDRNK